jgi:hypothetical protein
LEGGFNNISFIGDIKGTTTTAYGAAFSCFHISFTIQFITFLPDYEFSNWDEGTAGIDGDDVPVTCVFIFCRIDGINSGSYFRQVVILGNKYHLH